MAQANVIEVILKAVDQMSADLRKAEGEIARLTGATQRTEQVTTRLAGSNRALISTLSPMRGALGQVTTMLAQMNPQYAVMISSLDNLALSIANAGIRSLGFAAILRTIGITGIILTIVGAIGQMIKKWNEAREAALQFGKAMGELRIQAAAIGQPSKLAEIAAQREARLAEIANRLLGTTDVTERQKLLLEKRTIEATAGIQRDAIIDQIRKETEARSDSIKVLQEEVRVTELQINQMRVADDPVAAGERAAKAKAIELNLLRQLGPEQQAYIDQVVREARANLFAADTLEKRNEQLKFFLEARAKQAAETFKAAPDQLAGDEMTIQEEQVQISEAIRTAETKRNQEVRAMAESMADNFSRTLTDRVVMFMSGEGKFSIQAIGASIGKSLVTMMIQTMLKELLLNPLQKIIEVWARGTGQAPGEFSVFGGLSGLLNIGGWGGGSMGFAHGGMVVPPGALQKFQRGGVVRGPTLGVIGEEGPEIVARMKPMQRSGDEEVIRQNIIIVDRRPPRLERNDVLLILQDDLERGGRTAKGVENVIRRGGHGR